MPRPVLPLRSAALALALLVCPLTHAKKDTYSLPSFSNASVHDPSILHTAAGFYVFGSHLASAHSTDLLHWTQISTSPAPGNPLAPNAQAEFEEALSWVGSDTFWAPDVIQLGDGRYYMYYCVGRLDAPRAALGLAVSASPTGPYTNLGILLRSGMWGQPSPDGRIYDPTFHPNAVDPDVFFDATGRLWMVYGSYSGGIFILELNPATGVPLPNQGYGKKLIGGNHSRIEGAFMLHSPQSRYYYLFLSFGGLGSDGGYNIRVGRSRSPDGPFLDAAGTDLTHVSGPAGSLFDDAAIAPHGVKLLGNYQFLPAAGEPATATTRGYLSPGHNSAYLDPVTGEHFLVFHTRFTGRGEEHEVRVHPLMMNADGWLVAMPHRYAGEAPGRVHPSEIDGTYKLINHGKAISPAVNTSVEITLRPNGTVTGAVTGTWKARGGQHLSLTVDGVRYEGAVRIQWDDDTGVWTPAFSVLSRDGVSLWGSRTAVSKKPPRTVALGPRQAVYGQTFSLKTPRPTHDHKQTYAYSVLEGPLGLTIDRESGVISWNPLPFQVGERFSLRILALNIGTDPVQTTYTFTLDVVSPQPARRLDLDFGGSAAGGLLDRGGRATGFTARLPGTGAVLPAQDPNLLLNTAAGTVTLSSTPADFNGRFGLATNSSPGLSLAALGFTGVEDFAFTARLRPLPSLEFIDQVGLYVGSSSDAVTRIGTIVWATPERYSAHSVDGTDQDARFFGFGFDGSDGVVLAITRQAGVWRYFIDGVEWNPPTPPRFLEGRSDLVAGLFALTPLNSNAKAIEIDAVSAIVIPAAAP